MQLQSFSSFYLPREGAGGTYFHRRDVFFCHEVFFRMYLPLALKVYDRLPIDSLGFMVAGRIKNHLSGLIHQILTLAFISALTLQIQVE